MEQSAIAADGMAGEAVLNDAIEGMGNVAGMVEGLIKESVKARKGLTKEGRLIARAGGATSAVPENQAGEERKYGEMSVVLQAAALVFNLIYAGAWPVRAPIARLTSSQTAWRGSSTSLRTLSTS